MKKLITFLLLTVLTGGIYSFGQSSELIISEDFQDWEPTVDSNEADCEDGLQFETENIRQMELTLVGATENINVTLIKCGISPECDSKRFERDGTPSTEGITVGYVALSKIEAETDTIGQFIFGPIPHIDRIVFGHSATGSNRGIRIYKSSDGETWERASDDEFYSGTDSQAGEVNEVTMDETDVYIMFTSGIKQSDGTSQHSRLHNIEVYGIPGEPIAVAGPQKAESVSIIPAGSGLFRLEGEISMVSVYSTTGALVYSMKGNSLNIMDLTGVPEGIYIVQTRDKSGQLFVTKILR